MAAKKVISPPVPRFLAAERFQRGTNAAGYDGDTLEEILEEVRDDVDCGALEDLESDDGYVVDVYEYKGTCKIGLKTDWEEYKWED